MELLETQLKTTKGRGLIKLHGRLFNRSLGKARGGRIAGYSTDERGRPVNAVE